MFNDPVSFYTNYYYAMVSVFASSEVDRGFESRSGQIKEHTHGMCCFSTNHVAFRRKIKDWLAQNLDNMSEWGEMSICGLLCELSTITIILI